MPDNIIIPDNYLFALAKHKLEFALAIFFKKLKKFLQL